MPLLYVFEVLLLVAIIAGGFFMSWDQPVKKDERDRSDEIGQQPAIH